MKSYGVIKKKNLKESQIQCLNHIGRVNAGIVWLSWFIANKSINIQIAFGTKFSQMV